VFVLRFEVVASAFMLGTDMWGKFRRRVPKPREDVGSSATAADGDIAEVVLMGFRKLPSFSESPEQVRHNSNQGVPPDDKQDIAINDTSASCRCSPLMSFQKHLFGSFKGRQKSNNAVVCASQDLNSDFQRNNKIERPMSQSVIDSHIVSSCNNEDEIANGSSSRLSDSDAIQLDRKSIQITGDELISDSSYGCNNDRLHSADGGSSILDYGKLNSVEVPNPLPPRLMRREKTRSTDVAETRKSRLSNQIKDCVFLPPETARRSHGLVVDVACRPEDGLHVAPLHVQYGESDVLCASANTEYLRSSTEPSSAGSTDSGIQTSLYGSSDDRNHGSLECDFNEDTMSQGYSSSRCMNELKAAASEISEKSCISSDQWPSDAFSSRCSSSHCAKDCVSPDTKTLVKTYEAEYVPVDSSVSAIYKTHLQECGMKDSVPLVRQLYASVPKGEKNDDIDDTTVKGWSHLNADALQQEEVIPQKSSCCCTEVNANTRQHVFSGRESAMKDSLITNSSDIDSDNEEYLPPLPTRNYMQASYRCEEAFLSSNSNNCSEVSVAADDSEQTHMSWAEVIKEAQALGIPLSGPKTESSSCRMSASFTGLDMSDSVDGCLPQTRIPDRMTVSEIGPLTSGDNYSQRRSVVSEASDSCCHGSPPKTNSPAKNASPFRDKFRLQNLFSKRKNRKSDVLDTTDGSQSDGLSRPVRHSSAIGAGPNIQRRHLPPLPPAHCVSDNIACSGVVGNSLDYLPVASPSSPRQRAHRTMSTLTLPSRDYPAALARMASGSAWNGSSMSVQSHSAMSAGGLSAGSVTSIVSQESRSWDLLAAANGNRS
jgi:hypothetical protein